jgi:DNA-binding SARP family transcriptional activator
LATEGVWIDFEALEASVSEGNRRFAEDPQAAAASYRRVAELYRGDFLPDRRYEDWASVEQERLQTLSLGAMANLAALVLHQNPLESLHLAQRIRDVDPLWEEAWRLEMRAHMARGNRGLAIEAWERCKASLEEGMGMPPLPDTQAVYEAALRGEGVGWAGDPAGAAAG